MDKNTVKEKLQDIIREVVDNEELELSDTMTAADVDGWDSLAQVLIVGELQNEIGVKFTSSELSSYANVGELVEAIMSKL